MSAIGNYLGWALMNQRNQNPTQAYLQGVASAAIPAKTALQYAQAEKAQNELDKEKQTMLYQH